MRVVHAIPIIAISMLLAACEGSTNSTIAPGSAPAYNQAVGATTTTLATGLLTAAPHTFCPGISNIPFSAAQTVTHQHSGGFLYVLSGVATTQILSGTVVTNNPT